jgi:hypothetical protein
MGAQAACGNSGNGPTNHRASGENGAIRGRLAEHPAEGPCPQGHITQIPESHHFGIDHFF